MSADSTIARAHQHAAGAPHAPAKDDPPATSTRGAASNHKNPGKNREGGSATPFRDPGTRPYLINF